MLLSKAALCLARARVGIHPGLSGFLHKLPSDGVHPLARVSHKGQRSDLYPRVIAILLLPALIIPVFIWLPVRQPITWTLITLAYAAPALLIPYQRWVWIPLVLIGVAMISGWRSYRIRAELPKGEWITPIVSVDCDAGLRGVVADKSWCINAASGDMCIS